MLGDDLFVSRDPTAGSVSAIEYGARASSQAYGDGSESVRLESREAGTMTQDEKMGINSDVGTTTLRGEP